MSEINHNAAFQRRKLIRLLKAFGQEFTFTHHPLNAYKETDFSQSSGTVTIFGFYHEVFKQATQTIENSSKLVTVSQPSILCLWDEFAASGIVPSDTLELLGNTYTVTGTVNVQKMSFGAEIALEMTDNGKSEV